MQCRRHWGSLIGCGAVAIIITMTIMGAYGWTVPVAAAPSLSVQATRRDPGGAVVFAPTISDRQGVLQPALALPGEYVIATGSGFPANTAITATINDGTKTIPLTYQDLNANLSASQQPPVTDAMGGINGLAFQLPPASQLAGRRCTVAITVAGVVIGTLVNVDIPDPTATSGDTLVAGAAIAFYLIIGALFIVLLRRLPTYPILNAPGRTGNTR